MSAANFTHFAMRVRQGAFRLIFGAALKFLFVRIHHEHGQQLGGFGLARILITSVSIIRELGKVLSGAISNDRPIIGFCS